MKVIRIIVKTVIVAMKVVSVKVVMNLQHTILTTSLMTNKTNKINKTKGSGS